MIGLTRLVLAGLAMLACVTSAVLGVPAEAAAPPARAERSAVREVTLPAGTVLRVRVSRGFGSDVSNVEDPVQGTLAGPVLVGGNEALPTGSTVAGYVSTAVRPGRVKGRARVSVRFTELRLANGGERYAIRTRPWVAVAPATKKKDALTIGAPAAGGAIVGGILGGKKGAGIGALAGGGGGTAVVLATRGKDVRVGRGATLAVRLSTPLTVRVSSGT
jgi:hypothetical protein